MKKEVDIPHELFWDTDIARLNLQENKQYIIERALELGDEKAVRWLFSIYARSDIKKALQKSRNLSRKSSNYWNLILAKSAMIHSVLGADAKKVLKVLSRQDFLRSFYLAGGTGCALHIGHRLSQDFDFFSQDEFEILPIRNSLRNLGRFVIDYSDSNTLVGRLDGTKISLFHYAYPLIEKPSENLNVRIASLVDIGCMKIDAISSRGTKRDFVDLFFILKKLGLDMKTFFGHFERKYGPDGFNRHHVLKSLIYFEDANKEPEPEMLVDYSWTETKHFFVESVRTFGAP